MFPGASLPFGMMQWSPDTSSRTLGRGYNYSSTSTLGFSLNHASGPGCAVYEDVPILPATGAVPATPDALKSATETFSHSDESASPGQYQVGLGAAPDTINAQLAVTLRSGIGDFTFPAGSQANLIFKSGDSFDRNARRASPGPVNGMAPGITQQMTMYLYTATVPVNPDKTVVSVTLPNVTSAVASRASAMHIFALAFGHRGQ
jgi:putative alpha-1,2-mannosidase